MLVGSLIAFTLSLTVSCDFVAAFQFPLPRGEFITGVHDFEFVDTVYPTTRPEDEAGRRLMARVWYPACIKADFDQESLTCAGSNQAFGNPRLLFTPGEYEAIVQPQVGAMSDFIDLSVFKPEEGCTTHSFIDVPPYTGAEMDSQAAMARNDPAIQPIMPIVVFSHGGLGFISQNTALMEELASHGFTVVSIAHPGGAAGVMFPNGDIVRYDNAYFAKTIEDISMDLGGPNITKRYYAHKKRLEENLGLVPFLPRWRDDKIAVVDYLERVTVDTDPILASLMSEDKPTKVVYIGQSYGGAAAGSAAQADERAIGAINLDGTHQSLDLFDKNVSVPYLNFFTGLDDLGYFPNEFFFERLFLMGRDEKIKRIRLYDIQHMELSDMSLFDIETRQGLYYMGGGRVEGSKIQGIMAEFTLDFINFYMEGKYDDWPVEVVADKYFPMEQWWSDVSYIVDWALTALDVEKFEEEMGFNHETDSPLDDPTTSGAKTIVSSTRVGAIIILVSALFFSR